MISLKKELKRARLFEVQKLTKRIRAVGKRRGTDQQLEKNQRKVQRLLHELELIKDVDISQLCSRIQAKNDGTIQLAGQDQSPANSEEKAEWRILTSKTASKYLKDILKPEKHGSEPTNRDDRIPHQCDDNKSFPEASNQATLEHSRLESGGREQCVLDEPSVEYSSLDSSNNKEKGLGSMFVTSLSAISRGSEKKQPCRKRKVITHRNRLGQRARRKLWEQKFGIDAKHLTKARPRRQCTIRTPGGADKDTESSSKVMESRPLHPSWTAKKQQQTAIQQFQGHKIVFDSD